MKYINRTIQDSLSRSLARNKSVILLGARQTGKTTIAQRFSHELLITFIRPDVRQRYEKTPHLLKGEVEALGSRGPQKRPLVILDEVQKVPVILDVVQDLIDRGKANFILTGSSARKLRRGASVNFLPGRVVSLRMDPFDLREAPTDDLLSRLLYGSLPGILSVPDPSDKDTDLMSYVTTYLEEEIRAEAVVRKIGDFARFLELAAAESGRIVNLLKLSQEIGVSHTTIGAYYQILEDCLIADRIEPLTQSRTRKKLTKSAKYLFFDLGVRRIAAREGDRLSRETLGSIFEQFVGLELLRGCRSKMKGAKLLFWRDPDGPEVDWVIDDEGRYTPVEVKWTDRPTSSDIRHLEVFLSEYPSAQKACLVCQVPRKVKLGDNVFALPWQDVHGLIA